MKVLFFSDIHGIAENLKVIKKLDDEENFDKIVVLGDLYYSGPMYDNSVQVESKKVKDFLISYFDRLICMRGNCDSDVDVKVSDFPILDELCLLNVDGIDIYCTHGDKYNFGNFMKKRAKSVLVYGHEHVPYMKTDGEHLFICTGSISLPRNNSLPSYTIYKNGMFKVYDIDKNVIEEMDFRDFVVDDSFKKKSFVKE